MPIVDYIDSVTHEIFEVYYKTSEIPEQIIHEKTNNLATRVYSGKVLPVFKGSGFYETDYKKKSNTN